MFDLKNVFTPKQQNIINQSINDKKWKLMINHGAVRAGKTFADNFVFMIELRNVAQIAKKLHVRQPQYILAGTSSKTIRSNILNEIYNTFGLRFKFDKHNGFDVKFNGLPPVRVVQAYTSSIAGLSGIRGMTSYGAYINEASLANELVFNEIRDRCSGYGARVVCDTNPDVPTHWLKQYIDKAKTTDTIISNHFVLDDNKKNLDPAYIQSLKDTTPTGMMYDRAILGKWTSGEGIVYKDFQEERDVISLAEFKNRTRNVKLDYYCGVDWGFEHKGSIVVMADDNLGNTYLVEEHTAKEKYIDYWVDVARNVTHKYGINIPFYCDSARPEHVDRFRDVEHFKAINGYKSRLAGVEVVGKKIKANHFKAIKENINCFLKELYAYAWDTKTGFPIKENDDVMDAIRYAIATKKHLSETKQKTPTVMQQADIATDLGLI